MTQAELNVLLDFLKTMADETRLRIVGLLGREPHTVGDLAQTLDLTEPTISHHLARLRKLGLVNLKAIGTSRVYSLNTPVLKRLTGFVLRLEEITQHEVRQKPDMAWVEALNLDAYDHKVFMDYFDGTRLKHIPTKEKKLLAVLRWLATQFEPGVEYTERDVNALLEPVNPDYAQLRRELVEYGFLQREGGGGSYWRTPPE